VLIAVCGVSALAVNLIFSTAAPVRDAAPAA